METGAGSAEKIAQALAPGGSLLNKGKELLKRKREAFRENQEEFIGLHCELLKVMGIDPSFIEGFVEDPQAYERISQAYAMYNRERIVLPYKDMKMASGEYSGFRSC